jgi:hypothetical protein
MTDPNVPLSHKLALAQIAYSQATGHTAVAPASAAAPISWHIVAELAELAAARWQCDRFVNQRRTRS